jgi:hypothetical protein
MDMKKFFNHLISDSNKVSSKRVIAIICMVMFIAFGIKGLVIPFNLQFSIFYISICSVTIWIGFRFMSTEKALKYNILGQLSNFGLKKSVENLMDNEEILDHVIQPDPQVIEDLTESPEKD